MIEVVHGDVRRVLRDLQEGRFRTCVTSPPYWEQRDYLPPEHPDKPLEIGHEQTPSGYIETLVEVFAGVRRVLTDDGTLWLNLGDKYANDPGGYISGGTKSPQANRLAVRGASCRRLGKNRADRSPKNLLGLPWRVAFALQDDGWILRAEIIWDKPNAQPSSVKDRPTTAHEHVFLFAKSERYFYDQDAVREPYATPSRAGRPTSSQAFRGQRAMKKGGRSTAHDYDDAGRNMRSVWRISTGGGGNRNGMHVAPMPDALARRCILAGSAPGDHVLDPFGGRGTVARVAEDEGRHSVSIDLDERACGLARRTAAQGGLCPAESVMQR